MCFEHRLDCHYSCFWWNLLLHQIILFVTLKICHIFLSYETHWSDGFQSDEYTKCLMSWLLDWLSISVFVEIIVDIVYLRRCPAVHIVIPVADSVQLIEQSAIGTEEAELLARVQTPMPDLKIEQFQLWKILTMVYNFQNYWVSGLCPSSGILNARKHNFSESGSVSVLRGGDTYSVGFLRKR
jgi:hypothetical protein